MNSILQHVAEQLTQAYQGAFGAEAPFDTYDSLVLAEAQFGDVQSNLAMRVAAELKQSPIKVAERISAELKKGQGIASATVAGPGFINIRLASSVISREIEGMAHDWSKYRGQIEALGKGKRVVMDYSHPNIGKPMGVHHLLSTIIGDAVKRSLRSAGFEVIADNFIGDLGTQFGKLIWAVKEWGNIAAIEQDPITELQKLYVKFHIQADEDVTLDDAGREEYRKLEAGNEENRALWQKIISWSKTEIQPIYDELGVSFDYMHGESFYEDKMQPLLEAGQSQGVFVESQGALVCFLADPEGPPAVLRKSDGATLYITRDLARINYWEKTWQPDAMLVVVDIAQNFAQKQLYEVALKLNLTDAELTQVNFGRMRFADGAMSTRKGNTLLLKGVISEAKQRALGLIDEKSHGLSSEEKSELAHLLGVGAIKYNILSQNRLSDITFDWDTMLSFSGNSAPYLMYTAVRTRSLILKAEAAGLFDGKTNVKSTTDTIDSGVERELALALLDYRARFESACAEYKPSNLTTYLHGLAQLYNNLYNNHPIIDAAEDERAVRLSLCRATLQVLEHGLSSLGIEAPDKM